MTKVKLYLNKGDLEKTVVGYVEITNKTLKGFDINKKWIYVGPLETLHTNDLDKILIQAYHDAMEE